MPRGGRIALALMILAALAASASVLTGPTAFAGTNTPRTPPATATSKPGPPPAVYGSDPGTGPDLTGPLLAIGAGASALGAAHVTRRRRAV